jgi:hypothetical protein
MDLYRREIKGTIFFFLLYLLVCHTGVWSLAIGTNNDVRVLGFPIHYFVAIILGWFGVLAVSIWWNIWADRLEAEIEEIEPNQADTAAKERG